jgi:hypothetical protein
MAPSHTFRVLALKRIEDLLGWNGWARIIQGFGDQTTH